MFRPTLCFCIASIILAGCSRNEFVGRPGVVYQEGGDTPPPDRVDLTAPSRPYVIGPSDELTIEVFGIEELSRPVTVDLAGNIALPLMGSVRASGNTAEELASMVRGRLQNNYVRDPRVAVNVKTAANRSYTIDGAVVRPGNYPLPGQTSLMRVVAQASGTTEFSDEHYVIVHRRAGGQQYATLYDLRAIRDGIYPDPEIFTNDLIVVGESQARRMFRDVLTTLPLVAFPVVRILD